MPTFPIAVRNAQLDAHNARVLARIALETSAAPASLSRGVTAGGDARRLRGIPAIGRGVAGAVPGSAPHLSRLTAG